MSPDSRSRPSRAARNAAIAGVSVAVAWWLLVAVLQVAEGGFYSDDWGVGWSWWDGGYSAAVEGQFDVLGSKPLLAFALPATYAVFGFDPAWHHVLAATLTLGTTVVFYFVLRALRFEPRDAVPIALLALLFPWASGVRLWPTGSMNNLAILLLFAGLLVAIRGLRVPGWRGLLVHLGAATLYAASILVYESTTGLALFLWPLYIWLAGWRAALPRALMDVSAVGAAAIWSSAHTQKYIAPFWDQIGHIPDILRDSADLIAASLLPVFRPAEYPPALTAIVLAAAVAVAAAAAKRARSTPGDSALPPGLRWAAVAAASVVALGLCWAIFAPQAFYTPTFEGIEDRVNVLALYPAAILVYAVLRAAGTLVPRNGHVVALALGALVIAGYAVHDLSQQRDWARSAEVQEEVLDAIEEADPAESDLVLVFGFPGETGPNVPTFNQSYDLWPAAQIRTDSDIATYPVFEGSRIICTEEGVELEYLATPLYEFINTNDRDTPKLTRYGAVTFVDVAGKRDEAIRSGEQCAAALPVYGSR